MTVRSSGCSTLRREEQLRLAGVRRHVPHVVEDGEAEVEPLREREDARAEGSRLGSAGFCRTRRVPPVLRGSILRAVGHGAGRGVRGWRSSSWWSSCSNSRRGRSRRRSRRPQQRRPEGGGASVVKSASIEARSRYPPQSTSISSAPTGRAGRRCGLGLNGVHCGHARILCQQYATGLRLVPPPKDARLRAPQWWPAAGWSGGGATRPRRLRSR